MKSRVRPFPKSAFQNLALSESKYCWFRARSRFILWILRNRIDNISNFLEVGSGTGSLIVGIAEAFPELDLEAFDTLKWLLHLRG